MLRRAAALSAIAVAGVAVSIALFAVGDARAYRTDQLASLGYATEVLILASGCEDWTAIGYGHREDLGSNCDPGFQARLDAFVNATCPCAQTTSTTAPAQTSTAAATTDPPPATTSPPPAPPPPATTTVVASLPAPPFADFSAETVNPDVVSFTDSSTSSSAIGSRVWQFGDGAAAAGATVVHPFAGPGSYYVTLIVVDSNGLTSVAVHQLTIDANHAVVLGPRTTQIVAPARTKGCANGITFRNGRDCATVAIQKRIYRELVHYQDTHPGQDEKAYYVIAKRWRMRVATVRRLAVIGSVRLWPLPPQ